MQLQGIPDLHFSSPVSPCSECLTVWDVEPGVTHEASWLDSTGVCGVQQNQAGGVAACNRASCFVVGSLSQTTK